MDWFPSRRPERYLWWKNMQEKIDLEGPKFTLPAADITAAKAVADDQIAIMEATDAAQDTLDGARGNEKTATPENEAKMRAFVRNWRTLPAFATSGSEGELRLAAPESTFDPVAFKPTMKVSIVGGQIKVEFSKSECDAVAIYCRLRGTLGWTRIGIDTRSPYYDTAPLATPGVAEVREYFCRGMVDDVEIGQPSDMVSITFV